MERFGSQILGSCWISFIISIKPRINRLFCLKVEGLCNFRSGFSLSMSSRGQTAGRTKSIWKTFAPQWHGLKVSSIEAVVMSTNYLTFTCSALCNMTRVHQTTGQPFYSQHYEIMTLETSINYSFIYNLKCFTSKKLPYNFDSVFDSSNSSLDMTELFGFLVCAMTYV